MKVPTPLFRRSKKISAVYLFGSTATGKTRRGSDIDLAVIAKKTISRPERLKLQADLSILFGKEVDLVIFRQAGPLLQHQILKYGRLIFESDPAERIRQEVLSRAEYLDTRSLFRELPG
ncbi:MAG: nucleotidyltransferase domain-containing protein [Syntrophales bacterium]|jgi:predicted nucleotidyltransferase|nr:nucleotidyltransferase domain-containing protein [Syntrophales bacterium]